MIIAKLVFAFVTSLTVSLASQRYTAKCAGRMVAGPRGAENAVRVACLGSQVVSVLVLYIFRGRVDTLVAAGIGLLLPKNIQMARHVLGRTGSKMGRSY